MRITTFIFSFLLCSIHISGFAQTGSQAPSLQHTNVFNPEWTDIQQIMSHFDTDTYLDAPAFENCVFDGKVNNLPYKSYLVPVGQGNQLQIDIRNIQYDRNFEAGNLFVESVKMMPESIEGEWYPAQHVMAGDIYHKNGQALQQIRIYPILISPSGQKVKKADRISYRLRPVNDPAYRPIGTKRRDYADHSVLKDGEWYKIGVTQSGIYRLDASFFSGLGINTSNINPKQIRIFGNGGGMIPQANADFRHDDLVENRIYVEGENDNQFNSGDYVLFYGESPHAWKFDNETDQFEHELNLYSDTNFYFLNINQASGKRITSVPSPANSTFSMSSSQAYRYYELEKTNFIRSGRYWLGDKFDLILEKNLGFYAPDVKPGSNIRITIQLAGRSDQTTSFNVQSNGTTLGTVSIPFVNINQNEATQYATVKRTYEIPASAISQDSVKIKLVYNKGGSTRSEGWLDWIEVEYEQQLNTRNADNVHFHLTKGKGTGEVANVQIQNGGNNYRIWDITNPVDVQQRAFDLNGSQMQLNVPLDTFVQLVAFRGGYKSPVSTRRLTNQDLHGGGVHDYIMIVHPNFWQQADSLAELHRSHFNRSVQLVTPQQIYNEFSSGRQDVSAIRDFIKMSYDRSGGTKPEYVCMFGDGTYDYKNLLGFDTNPNFIPTYQSRNSKSPTASYTSDDYYGFLDDDEGFWGEGLLNDGYSHQTHLIDVAIGRIPVETQAEASATVNKIYRYVLNIDAFGSWRNRVVLVADHKEGEGSLHVSQADGYTSQILQQNPCMNIDKIYMDNYTMLNTPGGTRFPEGKSALIQALDEGSLIVNYTGHGGEFAWSNSRILELADISAMANEERLPAIVTATCEFGRYDDPERRSGAELMVIKPTGGAIALFTTLRLVFSSPNKQLNQNFYNYSVAYNFDLNRWNANGEIMRDTKNQTFVLDAFTDINSRNFTLLGDPGINLAFPGLTAKIKEINDTPVLEGEVDTLKSLSRITVKGQIEDALGNKINGYSGDMSVTVFDKPSLFITNLSNFPFYWQKNRIFNGLASVEDGAFSFEFVVPIDISYEEGLGKMSFYFSNDDLDGAGCYDELFIGGTDTAAVQDDIGPQVNLYINDNNWVDGSITGPDPYLYAEVFDESGINTLGSGIGHEISGILDGDQSNVIVLNDAYIAAVDDFRSGTIRFQLKDLALGEHSLSIRVWDVANNVSEDFTTFILAENNELAITQLLNYPNPFTDQTNFLIGHNQTGNMELTVRIYSVSGSLVRTMTGTFNTGGNINRGISWDGTGENGGRIGRGVYIYQATVRNLDSGEEASKFERLVILR